jgi:hypothetical protein
MKKLFLSCFVISLAFAAGACGDDEDGDGGGGGGCAHVQMVCASDPDVEITCEDFDSAPASVKTCAGNATTCDAVFTCLTGG